MLAERNRLQEQIDSIQTQLKKYPKGKLICSKNGNHSKWYLSDTHTHSYLPKTERQLAEQLAGKKYLSHLQHDLQQEQKAIDFYLRHHNSNTPRSEKLFQIPEYNELLSSFFTPWSQELISWTQSPYIRSEKFPEQLIHKTYSGNFVRSKSEAIIDMFLYTYKIPFRYECALQLGDITLFPDFTIMHPKTGELFYWEHFGMMDDSNYCKNMHSKLQLYTSHGIIPSIHLITTYETKSHPLSSTLVKILIEHYFT